MADRLSVWLVSPAWRRYAVTRLALSQREHLAGVLAARGMDCHTVIISDDGNLDIAREHGCETVEMSNDGGLGRRFNAGFKYAAEQGADFIVYIGSDDWLHPDVFDAVGDPATPQIVTGHRMAFVDLISGRMRQSTVQGPMGVIPWVIPVSLLERTGFAPIAEQATRGIDQQLVHGLRRQHFRWVYRDPSPVARVDFKSDVGLSTYAALHPAFTRGPEVEAWGALASHYPAELVDRARATHLTFA